MTAIFNAAEVVLWACLGFAFLFGAARRKGRQRLVALLTGLVFLAFSGSDYIEFHTGAWWRPWWLLVWKASCILTLLILYLVHVREKKNSRGHTA